MYESVVIVVVHRKQASVRVVGGNRFNYNYYYYPCIPTDHHPLSPPTRFTHWQRRDVTEIIRECT